MNAKKIVLIFLLLFGEVLIILGFLYFGKNLSPKLLTLNIIVSSIIYSLYFVDLISPMVDLKSKTQKTVGSIGLRWFFTFSYTLVAIGAIVFLNIFNSVDANGQTIIHGILFFFLLFGFYIANSASDKVQEVYEEEGMIKSNLEEMKKRTKEIQSKLELMKNIPADVLARISDLYEKLRFVSPSNTNDAIVLEKKYLEEINAVKDSLFEMPFNYEKIVENIQQCEQTYKERKHDKR